MSTALPPKPRSFSTKTSICIVRSKYNEEYTQALLDNCKQELTEILPGSSIAVLETPGAFEIPVTVEHAFNTLNPDIVITLGLIIRGETPHGDLVAESVTKSLQDIAVRRIKPIVHEVLLVNDDKQAYARCIGSALNRGQEAARAAHSMSKTFDTSNNVATGKKAPF